MPSFVARTGRRIWTSTSVRSLLNETRLSDPVEAMRAKAAALIERCQCDGPPIDHEMVASFQGIVEVRPARMNEAGALVPEGPGRLIVLVNESDSPARQRFSCMHEVAHTLFPNYRASPTKKTDQHVGEYGHDQEEEYLCDVGAAELLMPPSFFVPAVHAAGWGVEGLVEVAHQFEASMEAVAVNIAKTPRFECAVVVWHPAHKPTQQHAINPAQCCFDGMDELAVVPKKLRTRYAVTPPGCSLHFPRDKSVEEGTPILECYLTGQTCKGVARMYCGRVCAEFYTESIFMAGRASDEGPSGRVITLVALSGTKPNA